MDAPKTTPGQSRKGSPLRKSAVVNKLIDAAANYADQESLGKGGNGIPSHLAGLMVRAKNVSGGGVQKGKLIQLSDWALDDMDRRNYMFDADYNDANGYTQTEYPHKYGIAHEPLGSTGYWLVHIAGICVAWVNVSDIKHHFAIAAGTGGYMPSADWGHAEILSPVTSTGEQECVVRLGTGASPIIMGKATERIAPTGTVRIWAGEPVGDTGRDVTAYSWLFDVPEGCKVILSHDGYSPAMQVIAIDPSCGEGGEPGGDDCACEDEPASSIIVALSGYDPECCPELNDSFTLDLQEDEDECCVTYIGDLPTCSVPQPIDQFFFTACYDEGEDTTTINAGFLHEGSPSLYGGWSGEFSGKLDCSDLGAYFGELDFEGGILFDCEPPDGPL